MVATNKVKRIWRERIEVQVELCEVDVNSNMYIFIRFNKKGPFKLAMIKIMPKRLETILVEIEERRLNLL